MDRCWVTLIVAGLMEVVWAVAMDFSEGFTIWYYDVIVIVFMGISMFLLERALRAGIPVGTGYAVWTGIGAVGTIAASVALGNESLTILRTLFVMMVLGGIIGLQMTSGTSSE